MNANWYEKDFKGVEKAYQAAHIKIGAFFDAWFGKEKKVVKTEEKKGRGKKGKEDPGLFNQDE